MQTIYLDISNKGVVPTIYAKQGDVGRKFSVVLTDAGVPYNIPSGAALSVWYSGASGEGNYTDIGNKSAFSVNENKVTVEMIAQMLSNNGEGVLSLVLNNTNGNQIASWNIPYICEFVPGLDSEEAEEYYTAFSNAVENLPYPDASLSVSGKSADAKAVGDKIESLTASDVGALSVELVWSNASQGSEFPPQTIPLDLNGYDFVLVRFAVSTSTSVYKNEFTPIKTSGSRNAVIHLVNFTSAATIVVYYRTFSAQNSGITFTDAYSKNTASTAEATTNNNNLIPVAVYGFKGDL